MPQLWIEIARKGSMEGPAGLSEALQAAQPRTRPRRAGAARQPLGRGGLRGRGRRAADARGRGRRGAAAGVVGEWRVLVLVRRCWRGRRGRWAAAQHAARRARAICAERESGEGWREGGRWGASQPPSANAVTAGVTVPVVAGWGVGARAMPRLPLRFVRADGPHAAHHGGGLGRRGVAARAARGRRRRQRGGQGPRTRGRCDRARWAGEHALDPRYGMRIMLGTRAEAVRTGSPDTPLLQKPPLEAAHSISLSTCTRKCVAG